MKAKEKEDIISQTLLQDYTKLYRLAYSYAKNSDDALDIVQESAYKAIKYGSGLKNEKYVSTWLYRIVYNTAMDFLKKRRMEQPGIEDYDMEQEDQYIDFDVMNSLNKLEPKDRTVLILRFFEEQTIKSIANITNENVNTVKSRLYRALDKLKVELEEPI